MDQAIRIDNRIFERQQEQQYNPRSFRCNPLPSQPVSRIQLNSINHDMLLITLIFFRQTARFSQEPYLFAVSQAISKPFVPGPIPVSDPNAISKPLKWNTRNIKIPEKRSRSTPSRDLDSAMKLIPPVTLRKDVMNMEDDDGLDSCKGDNSARGMGVRGTEVVLAPRGEMGSFTQMPPIPSVSPSASKVKS
ncbi:hypothetical protein BASA83_006614 [Batrachochytrium salamandrivorans]|nr:hypothetical protein BASA83_006614 [Batrachochytrium salamandrivorans]